MKTLDMYLVYVRKDRPVTEHVLGPKSDALSKHTKVFIMKKTAPFNIKLNLPAIKKPLKCKTLLNILQIEACYPMRCDVFECGKSA